MSRLIYLASPYGHEDKKVMEQRYEAAIKAAAQLLHLGIFCYAPVVHNHKIAELADLGRDWKYWEHYDLTILARCDSLYVLMLDGWRDSKGVAAESEFARANKKPVRYMKPAETVMDVKLFHAPIGPCDCEEDNITVHLDEDRKPLVIEKFQAHGCCEQYLRSMGQALYLPTGSYAECPTCGAEAVLIEEIDKRVWLPVLVGTLGDGRDGNKTDG